MNTRVAVEAPADDEEIFVIWDSWEGLCNAKGWINDSQRSKALGMGGHPSAISKVRTGEWNVSGPFIRRSMARLGVPFEAIFGIRKRVA